jgi:hypothetical protein
MSSPRITTGVDTHNELALWNERSLNPAGIEGGRPEVWLRREFAIRPLRVQSFDQKGRTTSAH